MEPIEGLARRIIATRDAQAESELTRRLLPCLQLWAVRYTGSEDLAHDALLIVLAALRADRITDPSRVSGFALATCKTLAHDRRRTEHRRDALLRRHRAPEGQQATAFAIELDFDRLARCLAGLGDRERAVIKQTFWSEASAAEIAAELQLAPGHVRVVRHRAILQLRDCVEGKR